MTSTPSPADRPATRLIRAGAPQPGAPLSARTAGPAIQRGSTVLVDRAEDLYNRDLVTYGLGGLSAQQALQAALCELEGADGVRLFPTGLAAVTNPLLALLSAGDHLLAPDSAYGPTRRFCDSHLGRLGVATTYYPPTASAEEVMALATPATRLLLMESPGSLTFEMQDVPALAAAARARGMLSMIDNTYAAGWWFRPLDHGVDISVQALTKYVSGGSDVFMGAAATSSAHVLQCLDDIMWDMGQAVNGDDAYLLLRSLRTMPGRLQLHHEAALRVAAWLQARPEVVQVLHPALPGAPGHDLWRRDFTGAAGLFGVVLRPAPEAAVNALLNALRLFGLGFSWGGFESLAISCDPQLKRTTGPLRLGGPLIRLNIGLEAPEDLIADLERGLAAFAAARG